MVHHIYYYSATGNSLSLAKKISEKIGGAKIMHIAHATKSEIDETKGKRVAGIVFPVYYCGLPLGLVKFTETFDFSSYDYIYAVANFGLLPGLALEQLNECLLKRGKNLNAGFLIQMPDNYIISYSAYPKLLQSYIFNKANRKLPHIADAIMEQKNLPLEKSFVRFDRINSAKLYKKSLDFNQNDVNFTIDDTCIGCGVCKKVCHFENIDIVNNKPEFKHHCEHCLACIQLCPQKAIQYGNKTRKRKHYINPDVSLKELMIK